MCVRDENVLINGTLFWRAWTLFRKITHRFDVSIDFPAKPFPLPLRSIHISTSCPLFYRPYPEATITRWLSYTGPGLGNVKGRKLSDWSDGCWGYEGVNVSSSGTAPRHDPHNNKLASPLPMFVVRQTLRYFQKRDCHSAPPATIAVNKSSNSKREKSISPVRFAAL